VRDNCRVLIAAIEEKPTPKPREETEKNLTGGEKGGAKKQGPDSPVLALPQYQFLTKDGRDIGQDKTVQWEDGFTERDGGFARDLGEGMTKFFINYDNVFHLPEKQRQRGEVAKAAISEKYMGHDCSHAWIRACFPIFAG
jgi:hypothetical protein